MENQLSTNNLVTSGISLLANIYFAPDGFGFGYGTHDGNGAGVLEYSLLFYVGYGYGDSKGNGSSVERFND